MEYFPRNENAVCKSHTSWTLLENSSVYNIRLCLNNWSFYVNVSLYCCPICAISDIVVMDPWDKKNELKNNYIQWLHASYPILANRAHVLIRNSLTLTSSSFVSSGNRADDLNKYNSSSQWLTPGIYFFFQKLINFWNIKFTPFKRYSLICGGKNVSIRIFTSIFKIVKPNRIVSH